MIIFKRFHKKDLGTTSQLSISAKVMAIKTGGAPITDIKITDWCLLIAAKYFCSIVENKFASVKSKSALGSSQFNFQNLEISERCSAIRTSVGNLKFGSASPESEGKPDYPITTQFAPNYH